MKVFNKFWSIVTRFMPKKVAVLMLTLAVVLVPAALMAWGPDRPTFTMENPATYVTFNSITNNNTVGDERNFNVIREVGATAWQDVANMQAGKEYDIRLYVHNNAASNLNLVANDVRLSLNLPLNNYITEFEANAFLSSSNANPAKIWDQIILRSDKEFRVQVVSAKYFNNLTGAWNGTASSTNGRDLGSELFTAAGSQLGYQTMNGKIPGCLQYAGYAIVRIKPEFKFVAVPSYDVEKKVDGKTHNAVRPGDTMTYTLTARNTGNVDLTNVKINDTLPAYYQSATETLPAGATGSIISAPHTVTIPRLAVGASATITISYKVKGQEAFECGKTKNLINKVTSSTDQKNGEDRTDNNQVDTDVSYDCAPKTPSYDLEKKVDKPTAKPGETIVYTLTFKNTGEVNLTNVVIKDQLPNGINWTNVDINVTNGSGISDKDKLFTTGVKVAQVNVGGVVTIKITAKVASDAVTAVECGENKKTFTNKSSSTTKEKQTEDRTDNNDASTVVTVTKDCPPVKEKCTVPGKEHLDRDDPKCKPDEKPKCDVPGKEHLDKNDPACKPDEKPKCDVPGKEHLDRDDPACKPDEKEMCELPGKGHLEKGDPNCVITTVVTPPPTEPPSKGFTPEYIVATGPVETIAGIIAAGALTFGGMAYLKSRRTLRESQLQS